MKKKSKRCSAKIKPAIEMTAFACIFPLVLMKFVEGFYGFGLFATVILLHFIFALYSLVRTFEEEEMESIKNALMKHGIPETNWVHENPNAFGTPEANADAGHKKFFSAFFQG